jgi:hypothetical protein
MSQAKYTNPSKQISTFWRRLLPSRLPKAHFVVMAIIVMALTLVLALPSKEVSAKRNEAPITLKFQGIKSS